MKILLGIIVFHFLVMFRAKQKIRERVPYTTIFFLTAVMVIYVVAMMHKIEPPD
jgi:hypothetical protein